MLTGLFLLLLASRPATVCVDFSQVDADAWATLDVVSIERATLVRLVQEGFAVVPADSAPAVRLVVKGTPRELQLSNGEMTAVVRLRGSVAEVQLEVTQKLAELARAATPARVVEAPATLAPPAPLPPAPAIEQNEASWRLSAAFDVLARVAALDAQVSAGLSWHPNHARLGVALALGFSWSAAAAVRTDEGRVLLGPTLRLMRAAPFELELALLAGGSLHHWLLADAAASSSEGSRLDGLFLLELGARVALLRWLWVGVRLAPGISTAARQHVVGEVTVWSRGFLRLEGGLALGVAW